MQGGCAAIWALTAVVEQQHAMSSPGQHQECHSPASQQARSFNGTLHSWCPQELEAVEAGNLSASFAWTRRELKVRGALGFCQMSQKAAE